MGGIGAGRWQIVNNLQSTIDMIRIGRHDDCVAGPDLHRHQAVIVRLAS